MAHVIVEVNGRPYTMQCPDGEEEHLRGLARTLDAEVMQIKQSVGNVGDIRLLVMSGLVIADRLSEVSRKLESAAQTPAELPASALPPPAVELVKSDPTEMEALRARVTMLLEYTADRLEAVTRQLS